MERAGRVLGKLKLTKQGVSDEELAQSAWPVAVGKKIALRTHAFGLVRNRLVVEVEDAVWQRQLWTLREQILQGMEQVLGRNIVEEIEFRIAVPRMKPSRAEALTASTDEADMIRDPIFRLLTKPRGKEQTLENHRTGSSLRRRPGEFAAERGRWIGWRTNSTKSSRTSTN